MAATQQLLPYSPAPPPQMEGGDRLYVQRELEKVKKSLSTAQAAIEELQVIVNTAKTWDQL